MATAAEIVDQLAALATPDELAKVRKRLNESEPAFGLRMRDLFDTAKTHTDLELTQVDRLLAHPAYEPRMTAFCILDFKARRKLDHDHRREICQFYVDNHDRITTWDMVDRAAPRVIGGYVAGGPYGLLYELAGSPDPLRRRSAITAPLFFIRGGTADDLEVGFDLAKHLVTDAEPVVHNAVGIFLKHAGSRAAERLHEFLTAHAGSMPRAGLRMAIAKLSPDQRKDYLERST